MLLLRISVLLLIALLVPSSLAAQVTFSQIAITGGAAPGVIDGAEFDTFNGTSDFNDGAVINAPGDVAFQAFLRTGTGTEVNSDNEQAIFGPTSGTGSPLGLIVREDTSALGVASGTEFDSFFDTVSLNASGDVSFLASLRPTESNSFVRDDAVFGPTSGAGSPLGLVARLADLAPGIEEAIIVGFGAHSLNSSGDVVFKAFFRTELGESGNGIFGPTSGAGSSLGPIVQRGDPIPEPDEGMFDLLIEHPSLSFNTSGDVAFLSLLDAGPSSSDEAIFGPMSGAGSSLGVIAQEGTPAPGVDDGAVFDAFSVFSESGMFFLGFGGVVLNDSGDMTFNALLRTGTGNDVDVNNNSAIFGPTSGAGSPLGLIAREGKPAPGVDDGAEFANFADASSLNSSGDMAFVAGLRTGTGGVVDDNNDLGLFTSIDGEFQLIVREGDLFTVTLPDGSGTEDRTISFIEFSQNGMNDTGTLVFSLNFTDGTQGIFTAANSPVLLGDVNQDNVVNFLDISPFITVLSNGEFQAEADINEDGVVNFLDIAPFINLLAS